MTASLTPSDSAAVDGALDQELGARHDEGDPAEERRRVAERTMLVIVRKRGGGARRRVRRIATVDPQQRPCVRRSPEEEQKSVHPSQELVEREQVQAERGGDHRRQLEPERPPLEDHRDERRAHAQDEQDADQVGADDVADGQIRAAGDGGVDPDRELGQARPQRDDRQADDHGTDAEPGGHAGASADQELGAHEQRGESADDEEHARHLDTHGPRRRFRFA
jgi:hypothetical protein